METWKSFANGQSPHVCHAPNPPVPLLILSVALIIAIIISYIPKHYRIIQLRTSLGYSHLYFLLGFCSNISIFVASTIIQWPFFVCCLRPDVVRLWSRSFPRVPEAVLSSSQHMAKFCLRHPCSFYCIVNTYFRYALYIAYFPLEFKINGREWRKALFVFAINVSYTFAITLASIVIKLYFNILLLSWARILGIISSILTALQCAPQIYKTWKLKDIGALSIPAMALQTPGTFVLIVSLVLRSGTDYSMWISYLISGISQGILLALCIYYSYFYKKPQEKEHTPCTITPKSSFTNTSAQKEDIL